MAISKIPGSRSFIRGMVGQDIYTIARDAKGAYQQNVRSKPEMVVQANTDEQLKARMVFSQIYAASHHFFKIINHSWEGVDYGQPSVSRFVQVNQSLLRDDLINNWDEAYFFGWQLKGRHEICSGPWIVSEGSLTLPDTIYWVNPGSFGASVFWSLRTGVSAPRFGDIKAAFGLSVGDYFTFFAVSFRQGDGATVLHLMRYIVSDSLADDTLMDSVNVYKAFDIVGTEAPLIAINPDLGILTFSMAGRDHDGVLLGWGCSGLIASKQVNGKWCRSRCQLQFDQDFYNGVSPHAAFDSWKEALSK